MRHGIGFGLLLVLCALIAVSPALAATIEVSGATHMTANAEYDRNPSIVYDGSDYWLFWTKGDDISTAGVRGGSYDPDADTYVIYYKTAGTLAGLASVAETKLALSETARPAGFDQRVVSATYFGGDIYAFASSGQSGTDKGLYYYKWNGVSWAGPTTLIADATARGGHVNVTSDASYVYIVWEATADASSDCYTWDGTTLSAKIDISSDNQPKTTLHGTTLYVVSIEDGTGDIEAYSAAAGGTPVFSAHSTPVPGAGFYDPCIVSDGTDLHVVTAPWLSGTDQQYLIETVYSGGSWSAANTVTMGGYGTTYWWDYWPVAYYDGSDVYVFFTTETASPSYSDGEIAMLKMDWDLANEHYLYVQNAIGAATASDGINVAAGTYEENIVVNKALTLSGAQAGVDGRGRVATESELTVGSGHLLDIRAIDVVVDGFELTGYASAGQLIRCDNTSDGLEFRNNIVGGTAARAFWFNVSGNDITIEQSEIDAALFTDSYAIAHFDGSDVFDNLTIQNNDFYDGGFYAGDGSYNSTGMTVGGNLFDGASMNLSAQFQNSSIDGNTFRNNDYTHMQVGLKSSTITDNVFEPCGPSPGAGYPSSAFMLWGSQYGLTPSTDVTITGNTIQFNDFASPNEISQGVRILADIDATTIHTSDNKFVDGGAQSGAYAVRNQGTGTADASANWWDTNDGSVIPGLFEGSVDYTPWLDVGDDLGDPGFQGDFSELHVDDDSPQTGTATRLQEGHDLASGSTVNVADGTYGADPVTGRAVYITKDSFNLIGQSEAGTIIDGAVGSVGSSGSYWPKGIHVQANSVTVRNFTVKGFTGDLSSTGGYGVLHRDYAHDTPGEGYIFYNGCTLDNVTVQDCYSAVYALCFTHLTVSDCTVTDNYSDGMFIARGCDYADIHDNVVTNSGDHGIWVGKCWMSLDSSDNATITNNTVNGAREGGISFVGSDGATIEGNTITNAAGEGWSVGALSLKDGPSNVTARYNLIYGNDGAWGGYAGTGHGIGIDGTPSNITLNWNSVYGNAGDGCHNFSTVNVDATYSWWGDASGPGGVGPGSGDEVSTYVLYDPWIGKAGGENIVCDPDPLILNVDDTDGQIAVKYLGGGSGLLAGYSVKFSWDPGVALTSVGDVTEGTLLSSAGSTQFMKYVSGTNEITVDCALLSGVEGVSGPGTMFTIDFDAVAYGTSAVDVTLISFRDKDNNVLSGFYEDDGEIQVDITDPSVTGVAIENLTLGHTDEFAKNTDNLELTATVTDDYTLTRFDIVADLSGLLSSGGTAVVAESYASNVATWTTALANVTLTGDDLKTVTVTATDGLGNIGTGSDQITVDNTPPGNVTGFAAAPAHEEGILSWTNPTSPSLDTNYYGIVVRYDAWVDYPLYGTGAPAYPGTPTAGAGEAFDGLGVVTGGVHVIVPRDIHYYSAFAYDWALNYGGVDSGGQDHCTNYWLGDVAVGLGVWGYNGLVNAADIDKLGWHYGSAPSVVGVPGDTECDVGPTDDHSRVGIPTPDNMISFEDLMIFAMNYGVVAAKVVPFLGEPGAGDLALALVENGRSNGGVLELALRLEGNVGDVKGLTAELEFDGLEFLSARLGDEMSSPMADVFFWSNATSRSVQVDAAVLGTDVTIGGSGDVVLLTFQVLDDTYSVDFASAELRGAANEDLTAELEGLSSEGIPVAFKLLQNAPNPFNPVTKVAYHVPSESHVTIRVFDVTGRLVTTLVDGVVEPGRHAAVWNGTNDRGESVGSGVYFCTMETPDFRDSHKMTLLK